MKRFLVALALLGCETTSHPRGNLPEPQPQPRASALAIEALNKLRAANGAGPVVEQASLDDRCAAWAMYMADHVGMKHDASVYGTDERENILGGGDSVDPIGAVNGWAHSRPHFTDMVDRGGFPKAYSAGYGQYKGYACLRLCPSPHDLKVCN